MKKRIHVIANPAAGQPEPVLHTLNRVFRGAGNDWDLSITKESGDAFRLAREAAEAGADVVAAYGGDGTVMEVAMALRSSQTPLAILPGGTANLMAVELGIPRDLENAAQIAVKADSELHQVDMGRVGDDRYFMLRVGVGFSARKVEYADRALKDRFGILAYTIAGMKALTDQNKAIYQLILDGKEVEVDGLACLVENAGNMGVAGITPVQGISVSDGKLDVIVVRSSALITMLIRNSDKGRMAATLASHPDQHSC
ncbi:MAG: diacylglycerol/lipid kinase family protein [Anaerolineales bacterium]